MQRPCNKIFNHRHNVQGHSMECPYINNPVNHKSPVICRVVSILFLFEQFDCLILQKNPEGIDPFQCSDRDIQTAKGCNDNYQITCP